MKQQRYKTKIVVSIPRQLEVGVLYVSFEYNIAVHLCACGCGSEIATPISKLHGWILTYDGENTSLHPSIGNGAYQCKSHYWMKDGLIKWLEPMGTTHPDISKKTKWWKKLNIFI